MDYKREGWMAGCHSWLWLCTQSMYTSDVHTIVFLQLNEYPLQFAHINYSKISSEDMGHL